MENKTEARRTLKINCNPLFLWVGRLNTNKDPLTVIKAFKNYLSFQPGAKLYMIYQTDELLHEVKNLISTDNKTREAVVLVGKVDHRQLQSWYNAADFFISGSHYEGSGISVCEAMSCGCTPIITDIISFRRMTGPGKCGFLYKPGNDADLLSILLKTNDMNIEVERKKTLEQFKKELSFDAIAGKINNVISSL
jgi:glycosyltransferase involved in cell wall biosynthesis